MFGRFNSPHKSDTANLSCKECLANSERRGALGCGVSPRIPVGRDGEEKDWNPKYWRSLVRACDYNDDAENRGTFYSFANWGSGEDVDITWWMCPRYHDVFAAPLESAKANYAIKLAWHLSEGSLSAFLDTPMSTETEAYVRFARTCIGVQQMAKASEAREDS